MTIARFKSIVMALFKVLSAFAVLIVCGLLLSSLLKDIIALPPHFWFSVTLLVAAIATKSCKKNGLCLPNQWTGCIGLALMVLYVSLWNAWHNDFSLGNVEFQVVVFSLLVCLLTGFWEELFFRGFALRLLAPCGLLGAILVSTLIFAAAHLRFGGNALTLISNILPSFSLGLLFAVSRLQTNSIFPLAIGHAAINFVSSLFSSDPINGEYESLNLFQFSSYLTFAIPILVYCYVVIHKNLPAWKARFDVHSGSRGV